MDDGERVLVVVPCYNEVASIESLLSELKRDLPQVDVLVINDGSTDGTGEIARTRTRVLDLPINVGIGGAVQVGIIFAQRRKYDRCVQIDGDGQHPPSEVKQLLHFAASSKANIVIGSRFLTKAGFRSTAARRLGIRVIGAALHGLFGVRLTDPTSGMRALDRRGIALFAARYPNDFPEPISIGLAIDSGLTVAEVPVGMRERSSGVSSISGLTPLMYMVRVIGSLMLLKLERRPR